MHKSTSNFTFYPLNYPDINHIFSNKDKKPSKKRITRVLLTGAPRPAKTTPTSPSSNHSTNQPPISPSATRTAKPLSTQAPTSPAPSSNISTPLTPSLQLPPFDNIVNKVVSKSLIAALTSKDAVLKEVRDCILTNNESRLKELKPYFHSYWRDLHVRAALIDDIHVSHLGNWRMIFMATYCWWP